MTREEHKKAIIDKHISRKKTKKEYEPYCDECKHRMVCCFVKACETEELYSKRMEWFKKIST